MAEEFDQQRTEAPTQRRREQAREQGQVAASAEFTASLVLLAGVAGLSFGSQVLGSGLLTQVRTDFLHMPGPELVPEQVQAMMQGLLVHGLELAGVVLGLLMATGLAISAMQVG